MSIKTYDRFENALDGKTKTIGGMNMNEFKEYLMRLYPVFRHVISNLRTRSELIGFYKWRQTSPTSGDYKARSVDYNANIFKIIEAQLSSRMFDWSLEEGKYVGITYIHDTSNLINIKRNLNRLHSLIWTKKGNWRRSPNDREVEEVSMFFKALYIFRLTFETYTDLIYVFKQLLQNINEWSHLSVRPLKRTIIITAYNKSHVLRYIDCYKCIERPIQDYFGIVRGTHVQYSNGHPEAKAWYKEWLQHTGAPNRLYTTNFTRFK